MPADVSDLGPYVRDNPATAGGELFRGEAEWVTTAWPHRLALSRSLSPEFRALLRRDVLQGLLGGWKRARPCGSRGGGVICPRRRWWPGRGGRGVMQRR